MLECCKCGQQASERAYCACGLYNGVAGVVPESPEYQAPARVAPAIMYVPVPLAVTVPVPVNTTQTAESTDITRDVQSRFHIHYTARTMAKAERQQFRAMAAAAPGNGQRSQSPGVIAYLQAVTTLAISCGVDLPEASAACAGYAAGLEQMIGAGSGDAHRNFVAAIAVLYAFLAADEESWPRPDCALVESEVASRIIEHMASAEAPKQPASIRLRAGLMAVAAAERAIGNPAISRIIDTQMRAAAFCGRHALPESLGLLFIDEMGCRHLRNVDGWRRWDDLIWAFRQEHDTRKGRFLESCGISPKLFVSRYNVGAALYACHAAIRMRYPATSLGGVQEVKRIACMSARELSLRA